MATSHVSITVKAVLFDMDGTLIDSTPGVLKAWERFSKDYNLGDSKVIAGATHGRRLYDTLREYCKINDEGRLMDEVDRFEDEVIQGGPKSLPGVIDVISQLALNPLSEARWTIVTSASNKYAPRALARAGVVTPKVGMITSNDVSEGKPRPEPYLAGASICSTDPQDCLVIEDAVSGLSAGRLAGARTLAVCTSTSRQQLIDSGVNPDYIVSDLTKVRFISVGEEIMVTIDQA